MYVGSLSRDREYAGTVFMAHAKANPNDATQTMWMLVLAKEGYQSKDKQSSDQFFVTTDGYRYEGTPGQSNYKIIQFKKYAVRILQMGAHNSHLENETLSTTQLWHDYGNPKRAAELQWRLSISLSAVLLAVLAVLFCNARPRRGRYLMMLPAVVVYIIYVNMLFMARHWLEQGILPISLGMWWVHGVMLLFIVIVAIFRTILT
jgi:lipopolysaccharide export system permease protein